LIQVRARKEASGLGWGALVSGRTADTVRIDSFHSLQSLGEDYYFVALSPFGAD